VISTYPTALALMKFGIRSSNIKLFSLKTANILDLWASSILGQNPNRWSFIFHFTSFTEKILWKKCFISNVLKEWLFANALAL